MSKNKKLQIISKNQVRIHQRFTKISQNFALLNKLYNNICTFQSLRMEKKGRPSYPTLTNADPPTLELNEMKKWEQRKLLMIAINLKLQPIFQKLDPDYLELFSEMGTFQGLQQQLASGSTEQEIKKNFYSRHYEKILIHFFQYLFDFEIQTLQFTQKHQTILSFAQWIETEVVFEIPDDIRLLNVKKSQQQASLNQKPSPQKNNPTSECSKGDSLKRTFVEEEKKEQMLSYFPNSNKKIVVENEQKGVKFVNYNSRISQQSGDSELSKHIQKYSFNGSLIVDHDFAKRQIMKVNGAKVKKNNSQMSPNQNKGKNKNRNHISGNQEFENKGTETKDGQKVSQHHLKKVVMMEEMKNVPVIVLDTSQEKSKQKIFDEQSIKPAMGLPSAKEFERISQTSSCKNSSISIRDARQDSTKNNQSFTLSGNYANPNPPILSADLIMEQIAQKQRETSLREPQKEKKRRLHQFRAKLSCLLRYSEKRFYIFPDFAPDLEETDSNEKVGAQESLQKKPHKGKRAN